MNQPYTHVDQPYAILAFVSALHEMLGVQLDKNNTTYVYFEYPQFCLAAAFA